MLKELWIVFRPYVRYLCMYLCILSLVLTVYYIHVYLFNFISSNWVWEEWAFIIIWTSDAILISYVIFNSVSDTLW